MVNSKHDKKKNTKETLLYYKKKLSQNRNKIKYIKNRKVLNGENWTTYKIVYHKLLWQNFNSEKSENKNARHVLEKIK